MMVFQRHPVSDGGFEQCWVYLVSVCLVDQVFSFIVSMVNLSWQNPAGHLTSIQVAILKNTQVHYCGSE